MITVFQLKELEKSLGISIPSGVKKLERMKMIEKHCKMLKNSHSSKDGGGIGDVLKDIKDRISSIFSGPRNFASPAVRKFMEHYGGTRIVSIQVCRYPILGVIDKLLNFLSLGKFSATKKKYHYDDLFHLFMLIEVENSKGRRFGVISERNHVVNIAMAKESDYNPGVKGACMDVPYDKNQTLAEFVDNGVQSDPNFWIYDPITNNCQDYTLNMLRSNGILTPPLKEFVKQNASELVQPLVGKFARGVTDVAGILDVLIYGKGKPKKTKRKRAGKLVLKEKEKPKTTHKMVIEKPKSYLLM